MDYDALREMTETAVSQHVTQIDEAQKVRSEHNRKALVEV